MNGRKYGWIDEWVDEYFGGMAELLDGCWLVRMTDGWREAQI